MKPNKATNYKGFDYQNYLKTKYIYGMVNIDGKIEVSENTYLNPAYMFSNYLKNKIEQNLNNILGEDSGIVKRNTTSEIHQIFQKKLSKILE